jgi:formylglycine-generating enzyme required for sulfatase activity
VTNSQFQKFVNEGGYKNNAHWSPEGWEWRMHNHYDKPRFWNEVNWNAKNKPVVGVSWYEADAFARWAGGRLPDEFEWEAAARGKSAATYPWGDDWKDGICNNVTSMLLTTSPVGLFELAKSTDFAIHDMAGNVWNWCKQSAQSAQHVAIRGGSWKQPEASCRSAFRTTARRSAREYDIGFRIALDPSPEILE